jgi:hypothetical protein
MTRLAQSPSLQLSDGSYAIHRLGTGGPHHVFVSQEFKVTATA